MNIFPNKAYEWTKSTRKDAQLNIREMQIKTTMSYHPTAVRIAIIKKSNSKRWWRVWRKGKPSTVGGNVNWCNYYGGQFGG